MTPQNNLELNGNLHDHPLAELLVEISQACLNGSLRLASDEHKAIIYFDAGDVVLRFQCAAAPAFPIFFARLRFLPGIDGNRIYDDVELRNF